MDIDKLLDKIALSLERGRNESTRIEKRDGYSSEQINFRCRTVSEDGFDRYKELKAIAKELRLNRASKERIFLKQGLHMAAHEEEKAEYIPFFRYYPTYVDMNDVQLRYYFYWRSSFRRGEYEKTDVSYVFVYIYELLSLVGCTDPEDAFRELRRLQNNIDSISDEKDVILSHLNKWIFDFILYYGLDLALLEGIYDTKLETAAQILYDTEGKSSDEIFSALITLSSYDVSRSKLYKAYPEEMKEVAAGAYKRMCSFFAEHRKSGYFERLFGKADLLPYSIFGSAVFLQENKRGYEYEVSPFHRYKVASSGAWYVRRNLSLTKKNRSVGNLLKNTDRIMREEFGLSDVLKADGCTKILEKAVREEIAKLKEEQQRRAKLRVVIDMSILGDIRKSAEKTMDRLIVEEESEELTGTYFADAEDGTGALTKEEKDYLRIILSGQRYKGAGSASLLCDSINEKLYEMFSDTVIDFDGDIPFVIEDYRKELEEIAI